MLLESLLAYLHISAVLMLVVFLTSEGALCRTEWLNADALKRLLRVDILYGVSAVLVLLTGLARIGWGAKGSDWYLHQPLLHIKITLFVIATLLSIPPSLAFRRWYREWRNTGQLPLAADVRRIRRFIMIGAHTIMLIPLFAVLLARGVWSVG